MTREHLHSVVQGMYIRDEINNPGVSPYLSSTETLLVMGCVGANVSIGVDVNGVCLRLQVATVINTSEKRDQKTITQSQNQGQEVSVSVISNTVRMTKATVGKQLSSLRNEYNTHGTLS